MKRKVVVTHRWLEPPPVDRNGKPIPRNQWPRKRRRSWVVRWYTTDGKRRQQSFQTKRDAEELAAAQQAEFDRNPGARRLPPTVTLGHFADEIIELGTGPRGQKLMASSVREMQKAMDKLIAFLGPDVGLSEIGSADAVRFAAALRKMPHRRSTGRHLAAATVNKIVRTVKVAFSIAVRQLNYLDANPFANISQQKLADRSKRYVGPKEFSAVLVACRELLDEHRALWWQALIAVLYTTGMRLNEAMHLTGFDVDFEHDQITVIARDGILWFQPKGKRSRTIPTPLLTMDLLATMQLKDATSSPYLFVAHPRLLEIQQAKEAGRWSSTRDVVPGMSATWARILAYADIKRATFHDLRRSAITNWARRIPAHVTQRLAGHVSITTTMTYYVSVLDDDMEAARRATEETLKSAEKTTDALGTH